MAKFGPTGFDATQIDPTQMFDPVPAGKYIVHITKSEIRETKAGTGEYLWLEFEILDGDYVGRNIWTQLNIVNSNVQASEIAQRELSAICHAVGCLHPKDSIELHGTSMEISVQVKVDKSGQYGPQNVIKGYNTMNDQSASPPTTTKSKPALPADTPKYGVSPKYGVTPTTGNEDSDKLPWKR